MYIPVIDAVVDEVHFLKETGSHLITVFFMIPLPTELRVLSYSVRGQPELSGSIPPFRLETDLLSSNVLEGHLDVVTTLNSMLEYLGRDPLIPTDSTGAGMNLYPRGSIYMKNEDEENPQYFLSHGISDVYNDSLTVLFGLESADTVTRSSKYYQISSYSSYVEEIDNLLESLM